MGKQQEWENKMIDAVMLAVAVVSASQQAQQTKTALEVGREFVRVAREPKAIDRDPIDLELELPRLQQRKEQILKEMALIGNHDRAGVYHQGDGLGSNVFLAIAPGSGATYTSAGCNGVYDLNYGTILTATADGIE